MKIFNNQYIKRILSGVTGLVLAVTPISFAKAAQFSIKSADGKQIKVELPENAYLKVNENGTYEIVFEDGTTVLETPLYDKESLVPIETLQSNESSLVPIETLQSNESSLVPIETSVQERVEVPMSMEEFNGILESANKFLADTPLFNFYPSYRYMGTDTYLDSDMQRDMKCLVYYTNAEYIRGTELEQELVTNAYINRYNFYNDPNAMTNTYSAYSLINQMADYNHRVLASIKCSKDGEIVSREMEDNGIDNLIDVSIFCRDEHDRAVLHQQYLNLELLAKALISGDETLISQAIELNYTSLTSLNSDMLVGNNNSSLSVGASWLNTVSNGTTFINWLETYLDNKYTRKELGKYFDSRFLNLNQWFIVGEYDALLNPENNSNTFAIEYDAIDDLLLNQILKCVSTMHYYVYHTANIALTNLLGEQIDCSKVKTK